MNAGNTSRRVIRVTSDKDASDISKSLQPDDVQRLSVLLLVLFSVQRVTEPRGQGWSLSREAKCLCLTVTQSLADVQDIRVDGLNFIDVESLFLNRSPSLVTCPSGGAGDSGGAASNLFYI